jgi:integrase
MMSGDLPVGSPEHLLFPSQTTRFFEIFDQTLRRRYDGDYKHEIDWWVTIVALLGCRPFEALQIKYEHLDFHFDPRIIRILGTKNESAQRTVDINLFATDPVGRYLKNRLLKMGKGCFPLANYKSPTDDKKFERCIESANRLIGYAYGRLRAEIGLAPCSGVFTMTSFRHACAFRLHQTAVTDTLWGGNLWSRIASNSIAMGHKSMVTTWSSYIGTSALAIIWPSRGKNGKNYCPIRDNPHDIFDPKTESRTGKSC